MPYITTKDGTEIYYKDWGNKSAKTITFSHGWPLSSDDWENQMYFLASKGYRVIAHDRRGHGRSSQPWGGHDMDTYADDLHQLFEKLDLKDVMMVGHSTGGGEVARFLGRHGTSRVSRAVLVSAVTPGMLKTEANPDGVPMDVFDSFRSAMLKDRAAFFIDGKIWSWWQQGMLCGFNAAYECIKAFSETDTSEDLRNADIPILVLHGTDDQVVPIDAAGRRAVKLCKKGTLKEFPGAPHALPTICADEVSQELLKFLQS
ncbi:hypothetical protein CLAIMM_06685 [Cladophialophora immunda]|nr:hypothetical protein CLAIMM_06685 [Cladophialophora immunda]